MLRHNHLPVRTGAATADVTPASAWFEAESTAIAAAAADSCDVAAAAVLVLCTPACRSDFQNDIARRRHSRFTNSESVPGTGETSMP